jgi:hypothetical protein
LILYFNYPFHYPFYKLIELLSPAYFPQQKLEKKNLFSIKEISRDALEVQSAGRNLAAEAAQESYYWESARCSSLRLRPQ